MRRPKRTRRPQLAVLSTVLAFCASTCFSQGWGEPHLSVVPRTPAEAERAAAATRPTTDFSRPEVFEARPGGAATLMAPPSKMAFSAPSANMSDTRALDFAVGASLFEKLWVTPPSATLASDGLGPLYNARACINCHPANGRGKPPEPTEARSLSMFLRVSIPKDMSALAAETLAYLPNAPEPSYGLQIQNRSVPGVAAEGRMRITYEPLPVILGDGTVIELRKPSYGLDNPGYGPLHPQAQLSPRVAPAMIGLGLLEAIPEADILALADPDDSDGDGISGRANRVWSVAYDQWMLGRFGLKAGAPTVRAQSMDALNGDIGLSNPLRPLATGDCTPRQLDCMAAPDGNTPEHGDLEASELVMALMSHYTRNLAVPQRRAVKDSQVLKGKALFYGAGCPACHMPKFVTHRLDEMPEQSFQLIWPYTDLLLHDMGPGLADGRPEWQATGTEWRTAPLWGIGLTETVNGHSYLLHDGRARSILEAILWHGGEAQAAMETVKMMSNSDREALVAFLESL